MFVLKFDCKGNVSNVDLPMETSIVCKVDEDLLTDKLGKILYSVERMGYKFTTHDAYEVIIGVLSKSFLDSITYKFKTVTTYAMSNGKLKLSMKRE